MTLTDSQWAKIESLLPGQEGHSGRTAQDNRLFVEAVMWMGKNGSRWRALPDRYGKWNSVYIRFLRWAKKGIWQMIFNTLAVSADTEWLMIDSTIIRAHHCAAGAKKHTGGKP
jgi:transposase